MRFSVIVPAYNEGKNIRANLKVVSDAIASFCDDYEILAVNDGSRDDTASEILKAASEDKNIVPVIYEVNKGKGGAIIEGVRNAKGELIAFVDADLDLPPIMLRDFLADMEKSGCSVVIGSKMHPDSKVDYPFARKVFSFCYYIMLKILFGLKVKDTQTGIKLFKGDLIRKIAGVQKTKGFAFDIEQLALANKLDAKIDEMPITLNFSRNESFGRIKIRDVLKMFTDTLKIWWNLRIAGKYKI